MTSPPQSGFIGLWVLSSDGWLTACLSGFPSSLGESRKAENAIPGNSVSERVWLGRDEFRFNLACLTNSQRCLRNPPASFY